MIGENMAAEKQKNNNLKVLVSGLVKEQVLKIVPVIKQSIMKSLEKEIKYQISEAVNEKLMKVLLEGSAPRVGVQPSSPSGKKSVSSLMTEDDQSQSDRLELQQKIRSKILAGGNQMLQTIYEDIDLGGSQSVGKLPPGVIPPPPQLTEAGVMDSDDEGVNLDSFPGFRR